MKKLPDKIIIYTLSDPITLDIRYVGITSKTLEYRYKRHFYDKKNYKKRKWFKQLDDISLRPIIEELDVVDFDGWEFWEKWYISLFKSFGFDLVNLTEGGEGMFGYIHTEETKQKIREKRKLQIFTEKTLDKLSEVNMGNLKAFNKKHSKEVNILKSKNQRGKFGGTILKISVDGNIEKFDSISDAGDSIGVKQNNICWRGRRDRRIGRRLSVPGVLFRPDGPAGRSTEGPACGKLTAFVLSGRHGGLPLQHAIGMWVVKTG